MEKRRGEELILLIFLRFVLSLYFYLLAGFLLVLGKGWNIGFGLRIVLLITLGKFSD